MTLDVANLLAGDKNKEREELGVAPDPMVDPEGAFAHHRKLWPSNGNILKGKIEAGEGSDRVRLRRMAEELVGCGVVVDGSFAHQSASGVVNVYLMGSFDGSGDCYSLRGEIREEGEMERSEMLGLVQEALQSKGFLAVVTMDDTLAVADEATENSVRLAEANLSQGSYYWSRSPKGDPVKLLQFTHAIGGTVGSYAVKDWAEGPFTAAEAKEWCDSLVRSTREATAWKGLGLSPAGAKEWIKAGASNVDADLWIRSGYNTAKAQPWQSITRNAELALEWISAGFSLPETEAWFGLCSTTMRNSKPGNVKFLTDAGVGAKQAQRLREAGCDGSIIETLEKWVGRYKIELSEALTWAELGPEFAGPGKRGRWNKAGFTPADIRVWQKAIGRRNITVDEVKNRIAAGFDPTMGADWLDLHTRFRDTALIAEWTEAGLDVGDARPWVEVSDLFCDYQRVQEWTEDGLDAKEARRWTEAHRVFAQRSEVKRWQAACPEFAGDPNSLADLAELTRPETLGRIKEILARA